jgi:lysophospholipase L1-like esterase
MMLLLEVSGQEQNSEPEVRRSRHSPPRTIVAPGARAPLVHSPTRTKHPGCIVRTMSLRPFCRATASLAVVGAIALTSCGRSTESSGSGGFESPDQAADAFASGDLPDIEPWDSRNGACRILLIGDSLTEAIQRAQVDAFTYVGCESIVDGLAARSLSRGWQCLGDGGRSPEIVVRGVPEVGNPTCRPSGLELLALWSEYARAASAVVIALGTNDAGIHSPEGWIRHWELATSLSRGPLVFVTAAARPGDRWVADVELYNATLRWWCPSQQRCSLAEWDRTAPARDVSSYTDHVHLTRAAGEMRALFIAAAARRVAVPAPSGPRRWKAPVLDLTQFWPSSPPSSSALPPGPSQPTATWPPQPSSTFGTSTTSQPGPTSPPVSLATTTTTTIVGDGPPGT